jgi:hypothetical protein
VTEPLKPREVDDILSPNPPSWGQDGYPTGFSFFGMRVIANPDVPPGTFRLVQDPPPDRP